jgi:hypothetical protein
MSVQLQVVDTADIETCGSLSIGLSGVDSTTSNTQVNLHIMRASDVSGSNQVAIGQTNLADASFRWLRVAVGPGSYIINGTRASDLSAVVIKPTDPFTVVAGADTSCVQFFDEGLRAATSTTTTATVPTISTPTNGEGSPKKSNVAVIAGGVAAGVVVLLLLAGIVWLWLRRRRHAPVAVRKRRATMNNSIKSLRQDKAGSFGYDSDPIPLAVIMQPASPLSPRQQLQQPSHAGATYANYPRALPPPPPVQFSESQHHSAPYAESTAVSDDSFAEERDALRAEFQSSDGMTSAGGGRGRNGRPFSTIESSVGTDAGLGLERDRVSGAGAPPVPHNERRPRQMTFAVSNPDHTVWEDEVYGGGAHASRR